jgi:hypothetical protein
MANDRGDDRAFARPAVMQTADGHPWDTGTGGMTLRTWLAGKALAALIVAREHHDYPHDAVTVAGVAGDAVAYADALLAALAKGG